ncbi:MAG: YfhO family protein [Eubacterium sp.]|nr:YfhO family protein [Eubacterium sp.]
MNQKKPRFSFSEWVKKNKFFLLAFILPVIAMLVVYAFKGIFPFGSETYLRSDCYHQYTPYLNIMQDKMRSFSSLFYTWEIGGGMNFLAIIAYYIASPFNLLLLIWPSNSADITSFFIILKMGLAGFSMSYYLTKRFNKESVVTVMFGMGYALSAYFAAYSWNIMWLDCMWLLPFIVLGLDKLVRERKCKMYCISLALGIFSNYYIGIMLCIFSVLYFIYLFCTADIDTTLGKVKSRLLIVRDYVIYSLLGGAMAAAVVLPEYFNLLTTKSANSEFPTGFESYYSFLYMIFRSLFSVPPAELKYPYDCNIYCSLAIFILIPLFLLSRKIKAKERVGKVVLMAILLLSFSFNIPNYIWHGLHFPNSLACRESFIYIFIVLVMGYEAVLHIKDITYRMIGGCAAGAIALIFLFEQVMDTSKLSIFTDVSINVTMNEIIYPSIVLVILYAALLCWYKAKPNLKGFITYLIILAVFCELTLNFTITGIQSTSNRESYYDKFDTTQELNEVAKQHAESEGIKFFRTEMKDRETRNDGARYNYNSISTFSSVASAAMQDYYDLIGLQTSFNAYEYNGHTPLTAALFAVKYEYTNSEPSCPNEMELVQQGSSTQGSTENGTTSVALRLYQYKNSLPLGFMINSSTMANWQFVSGNPFATQNNFVKAAIANGAPIFHKLKTNGSNEINVTYDLDPGDTAPNKKGNMDVYFFCSTSASSITATVTGGTQKTETFSSTDQNFICHMGDVAPGSKISLSGGEDQALSAVYAYAFDNEAWEADYAQLAAQPMNVTDYSDSSVEGTVDSTGPGLLYTSIPYDAGWTAYVDGEKVETSEICNKALLGISLPEAGHHEIVLKYVPQGFVPGLLITIGGILIFVGFAWRDKWFGIWEEKKRNKRLKDQK